jgi:hypothetical protein
MSQLSPLTRRADTLSPLQGIWRAAAPGHPPLQGVHRCAEPRLQLAACRQAARGAALQRRRRRHLAAGPERARRAAAEPDKRSRPAAWRQRACVRRATRASASHYSIA